jgi:uncharacterized protein YbaR (Trm112 family)
VAIDRELLSILACPQCKGSLRYREDDKLLCEHCRVMYPIRDGIPIMLTDEAIPLDDGKEE